ncbi:hypothetical protein H6P81_016144 [Aristolochia fimbriata]|uniref:AIPP2-like SPOC-like domain-containing protein n=1 Tax=Aristolochia fimbriata TaxID=158543 RepID=A0AAV7E979_ARIFI|nr:hypothetical protein H6P81_016144 [Aristolochia fimbriata]
MLRKGSTRTLPMKNVICRTAKRSFPSRSETTAKNNVDSKLMKDASMRHNDQIRKQTYACVQASGKKTNELGRCGSSNEESGVATSKKIEKPIDNLEDASTSLRSIVAHPLGRASKRDSSSPTTQPSSHNLKIGKGTSVGGHKTLEALGRMPTRLIAVLLPRFEVWPRIFQKQFLDDDDVALYFLPSDCESSKERYIHFLKMIDTSDLAIRCHFKGQTLVPYLWGVLCHPSTSIPASRNGNLRQRFPRQEVSHLVLPILSMALLVFPLTFLFFVENRASALKNLNKISKEPLSHPQTIQGPYKSRDQKPSVKPPKFLSGTSLLPAAASKRTSNYAHELPKLSNCGEQSSSYRPDLTLEDIEKLIDDLVRETTTVWQMDEFRCRKPTTIDEAKAGVGRGCCEPFFLFIPLLQQVSSTHAQYGPVFCIAEAWFPYMWPNLEAAMYKLLSCDVASKCEHLYQL